MSQGAASRPSGAISRAAGRLAMALDPVRLFEEAVGKPDPWQASVLRSEAKLQALLSARQTGKSATIGVKAVHRALYTPGSLVLLLSPSLRQSSELLRSCLSVYDSSGRPVEATAESALRLELENGSRIISLPGESSKDSGKTIRGFAGVDLLVVDESCYTDPKLYFSALPMVATSGGTVIGLSTPAARVGWFFDAWTGSEPWDRSRVTAYDCPRIPGEFIERMKRTLPPWAFQRDFLAEFTSSDSAAFPGSLIDNAIDTDLEILV